MFRLSDKLARLEDRISGRWGKKLDRFFDRRKGKWKFYIPLGLFSAGGTTALLSQVSGLDDFELICFLVVK